MGFDYCFVCGDKNPHGLNIKFHQDGDAVHATFHCEERHIGWPNVQHGGITSSLLDEASAYVPLNMGLVTVTAELNISFKAPVQVGETVHIEAHPSKVTKRLLYVEARMVNSEGEVKATSNAKMIVLSPEQQAKMGIEAPIGRE
ncbi:phenylacetic acid degradation protein [Alicyclobacillus acidoterrestris]|uniref:PaaI family thioesterase n=1 Tax=Alicyclobacillus suci TaxID=2816080 RepID=UPI0011930985|nr:PaaI family thioesterase [Alicyclobacillus suci]GEO25995.1 phenylacetic acid degradation protein [Alicyclobacillus acidoterrestris]